MDLPIFNIFDLSCLLALIHNKNYHTKTRRAEILHLVNRCVSVVDNKLICIKYQSDSELLPTQAHYQCMPIPAAERQLVVPEPVYGAVL